MEAKDDSTTINPHPSRGLRSFWRRTAPLHALSFLLIAETVVSLAFITYFSRSFKISRVLILIHLPLATGLFVVSAVAPALLLYRRQIRARKSSRYLLALVPGFTFTSLVFVYVVDFASYRWMGSNVNYKLVRLFFFELLSGGELVSLSRWIYISTAALATLLVAAYLVLAPTIFKGLEALLLPEHDNSLFRNRRRRVKSFAVIGLLLLGYGVYLYALWRRTAYSELLSSDPILSFVRSTTAVFDENYPAFWNKLKEEELRCRASYPRGQQFEKKNVVIIIVDSLRADHTQAYGYYRPTTPFIESLLDAGRLRKVELATSTCPESNCGILSTLSSKTSKRLILEDFKIHDLLRDLGYKTYFILSGAHDWHGLREIYGHEMTLYFDGNNSTRYASADDRVISEGFERVPNYGDAPAFFYIHLMSVHIVGIKQDAYRVYQPSAVTNDWNAMLRAEFDQVSANNNYDNGVTQADATIKEIFAALDQKGYLHNSVVLILADHGEGLGERGKSSYGHTNSLYQEFIRIPLMIYDESPTRYANLKFATQIDVAPTIVDRLGLAIPPCWQGSSLLNSNGKGFTFHSTTTPKPCFAVLYRTDAAIYKYIYCSIGKKEELYDLTTDPNEQLNLIDTAEPSLVQRMRAELERGRSD